MAILPTVSMILRDAAVSRRRPSGWARIVGASTHGREWLRQRRREGCLRAGCDRVRRGSSRRTGGQATTCVTYSRGSKHVAVTAAGTSKTNRPLQCQDAVSHRARPTCFVVRSGYSALAPRPPDPTLAAADEGSATPTERLVVPGELVVGHAPEQNRLAKIADDFGGSPVASRHVRAPLLVSASARSASFSRSARPMARPAVRRAGQ